MMTKSFVDYNGVIVEKYNVTKGAVPHRVDAEYGNQDWILKGLPLKDLVGLMLHMYLV